MRLIVASLSGRFSGSRKVERHSRLVGPQIQRLRDELGAVVEKGDGGRSGHALPRCLVSAAQNRRVLSGRAIAKTGARQRQNALRASFAEQLDREIAARLGGRVSIFDCWRAGACGVRRGMFVDYGHMTRRGASEYTQRLFEDVSERTGGF